MLAAFSTSSASESSSDHMPFPTSSSECMMSSSSSEGAFAKSSASESSPSMKSSRLPACTPASEESSSSSSSSGIGAFLAFAGAALVGFCCVLKSPLVLFLPAEFAAPLGPPFASPADFCFFTAPLVEAELLRFFWVVEGPSSESGMPCFCMRREGPLEGPILAIYATGSFVIILL